MTRPLDQLEQTILDRKAASDEKSYTAKLLAEGIEKIGGKVIEEAAEVVEAAGEPEEAGRNHTIAEAGDLIYHLLVLLASRDIRLDHDLDDQSHRHSARINPHPQSIAHRAGRPKRGPTTSNCLP